MPVNDMIEKRKALQEQEDDDFTVGTIAGLEDEPKTPRGKKSTAKKQTKNEESVSDMTTATIEKNVTTNVSEEMLEGTVSLKVKNNYEPLVDVIVSKNDDVIVQKFDTYFQVNARQIQVTRQDAESALGKMNNGRWRMLFMNREGEVANFNDYEFVLGIVETEVEERKEQAQLNTRILAEAKLEMDETRDLLGMTQAQFLEVAIREFAEKVKSEMI